MSKQCSNGHVWENGEATCNRCGGVDVYAAPIDTTPEVTMESNETTTPAAETAPETTVAPEVAVEAAPVASTEVAPETSTEAAG